MIYHTKILCHHIEHILFFLWLKYGTIWTNISIPIESFSINYVMGWFPNHLSRHLRTCFNYLNHKKSSPFQSKHMWISNEKKNLAKKYFINIMVVQFNVLTIILGWNNPY
jgi:hypothetical protein